MTKDEIIRMAREAGLGGDVRYGSLERFAAFVAAAEREKVARWQIGSGYSTGHGDTIEDLLVELEWQVREAERQRLHDVFMAIHHAQTHRNNYWRFAANQVLKCEDLPEFRL